MIPITSGQACRGSRQAGSRRQAGCGGGRQAGRVGEVDRVGQAVATLPWPGNSPVSASVLE